VPMADKRKDKGSPVVVAMEDAARELRRRKGRDDPPPAVSRNGIPAAKWPGMPPNWHANDLGLPIEDPCPVEPIGIEGELYHLVDSARQFRSVRASDLSHAGIQGLFAATPNYPAWAWPRHGRSKVDKESGEPLPPPITSFKDDDVRQAIMLACTRKGLFSPTDKLRGRGAWKLRGGALVYHAGECLWTVQNGRFVEMPTGVHEGFLYPRLAPLPDPWTAPITSEELTRSVGALFQTFKKWNWERPDVDPVLLLGWIGVAYLGGALDWRSAMLLIGDKGTGKSTLQRGLLAVFGDALFHSADTTAAGIYQRMAHDARPVALDELEPGADPRKISNVVQLMRDASSGAMGRRGGADGTAAEFQMRSAFLFSAINNPVQKSQDLSRIAILRLRDLDRGQAAPPAIDTDITGRICLSRVMLEWERFGDTFEAFAAALKAGGHVGRGADTYGTLLTCAELLLGPELAGALGVPLSEDPGFWTEHLAADTLPEVQDAMSNWRACIHRLLTAQVQTWRNGKRQTVGALLAELENPDLMMPQEANKELELTGLKVLLPGEVAGLQDGYTLAVPNTSQLVASLFDGSDWAAADGASGPWKDALRQAPADIAVHDRNINRIRIGGVQHRCSLIVLKRFHEAPER
jgi:hypothetical protein